MRRLKTNARGPPLVSKVLTFRWSLQKEREIPPFVGTVSFLCACVAPLPVRGLWEFLHISIIILIQFTYLFIPYTPIIKEVI